MSGFTAEWLALREPADAAARSVALTRAAAQALSSPLRALDLATGSGSNARYLAPHLLPDQEWLLVDDDDLLLKTLPERLPGVRFDARRADLRLLRELALVDGRTFVTGSALLDLVSEDWLAALAAECARAGAVALFALTYDGRIECSPTERDDALVRELVNRHQRTDKGFGTALGPDAPERAAALFADAGYRVRRERSDWVLGRQHAELQRQLVDGWAAAAIEIDSVRRAAIEDWRRRRQAHIDAGRSQIVVGHEDLLATR